MKETSLTLGSLPQRVGSEVDFVPLIVEPEDFVTVVLKFDIVKTRGSGAEEFEHFAFVEQWPQIDDAGKTVFPDNFGDTEYDRFGTLHGDCVSHLSRPASDCRRRSR
jgi:hypothetical protein